MISESFAKRAFIKNWIGRGKFDSPDFALLSKFVNVSQDDIDEVEEVNKPNFNQNEELEVFAAWLLAETPFTDVNMSDVTTLHDLVEKVNRETALMGHEEALKLRNKVAFSVIQIASKNWIPFMPIVYKELDDGDAKALADFCAGSGKAIFENAVNGILDESPIKLIKRFANKTGKEMTLSLMCAFRLNQWELKIIDSAKERQQAIMCHDLKEIEAFKKLSGSLGRPIEINLEDVRMKNTSKGGVVPANVGYVFTGRVNQVAFNLNEKLDNSPNRPLISSSIFRTGKECSLPDGEQVSLAFIIKAVRLIFGVDDFGMKIEKYLFPSNCLNALDFVDIDTSVFKEYYPTSLKNYAEIRCLEYYDQRPFLKLGCLGGHFVLSSSDGQPKSIKSFDRDGNPINIVQDQGIYSLGSYAVWMDETDMNRVMIVPLADIPNLRHIDVLGRFPSDKVLHSIGFDYMVNIPISSRE